jgi:hypothetical protein
MRAAIALLIVGLLLFLVPSYQEGQRVPLHRIGPNAGRVLRIGEVGWLAGTGEPTCQGATLIEQGRSPDLTVWRVIPRGKAWQCTDGAVIVGEWAVWLPL